MQNKVVEAVQQEQVVEQAKPVEQAKKTRLTEQERIELAQLLMRKPEARGLDLEQVKVRCNRQTGVWELENITTGKAEQLVHGVITGVRFQVKRQGSASGCGGQHVGFAVGGLLSRDEPKTLPESVRHLSFAGYEGYFLDQETGKKLAKVDYLVLQAGCHSAYITPQYA